MKKILLSVGVLCAAALFLYFLNTGKNASKKPLLQKETQKEIEPVKVPETTIIPEQGKIVLLNGIVVPEKSQDLVFQVEGMLENGEQDFQKGMKFRKNQLLFQVNNLDAFMKMQAAKLSLKEKLHAELPQIMVKKQAWENYISTLEPVSLVGELPASSLPEEQTLLDKLHVAQAHQEIRKMESGMSNYFYIAPFDGIVLERSVKPGTKIKSGQTIAQIGAEGKSLVKVKVNNDFPKMESSQKVEIVDEKQVLIGEGKYVKSISRKGFMEIYFSLDKGKKLPIGTKVFVKIN